MMLSNPAENQPSAISGQLTVWGGSHSEESATEVASSATCRKGRNPLRLKTTFLWLVSIFLLFVALLNGTLPTAYAATGELYFIHQDHLGSTTLITDENGEVVSQERYFPYGEDRINADLDRIPTERNFTGQIKDRSTALHYYNARYYDPALGTFTSADSINNQLNRYSYAGGNPVIFTDPTGHALWPGGGGATGGPYIEQYDPSQSVAFMYEWSDYRSKLRETYQQNFPFGLGRAAMWLGEKLPATHLFAGAIWPEYRRQAWGMAQTQWVRGFVAMATAPDVRVVGTKYVASGGEELYIDPRRDPALRELMDEGAEYVWGRRTSRSMSRAPLVAKFVKERVPYSEPRHFNVYSQQGGKARLGQFCSGGVCRERAAIAHAVLANVGKESRMAVGNLQAGRHAWVEYVDTRSGRWMVLDPEFGRVFDQQTYYNKIGVDRASVQVWQFVKP